MELQILDLGPFYMDGNIRYRPTTFMWTPRFKKAFFKSKLQQQQRSPNLSCSPDIVQCSARISSSRIPNDLKFLSWKDETIPQNFHDVTNFLELRIVTKSRCGHPLINQSTNQQFRILAYKRRHLPCIQASWCSDQDHALALSLYFVMLKFCLY